MPFMTRLGITDYWGGCSITVESVSNPGLWSFEGAPLTHIILSGMCFLAAIWHWMYRDLELFRDPRTGEPALDLQKIFGIHLFFSGLLCFGFGAFHVTGLFGPGIWVLDAYRVAGKFQPVAPSWGADGFNPFNPGGIEAHHISAGIFGIFAGIFHLIVRPPQRLYRALRMDNIKTALSISISEVFFAAFVTSGYTLPARIYTENTLFLTLKGEGIFSVVFFNDWFNPFYKTSNYSASPIHGTITV